MCTTIALSKKSWIDILNTALGCMTTGTLARNWLLRVLRDTSLHHCNPLTADDLVDIIHDAATSPNQLYSDYSIYRDWLRDGPAAEAFAHDLATICRCIGGERIGDAVYSLVHAERDAVMARWLDFRRDVYRPLYLAMMDALRNSNCVELELDGVRLVAKPLMMGRAWFNICHVTPHSATYITLGGGELTLDGRQLGLRGVSSPSLLDVLNTFQRFSDSYQALSQAEKDQLVFQDSVSLLT